MEKTGEEKIKFVKDFISAHGTNEKLEKLLYGLEYENVLRAELIPEEIFHDLFGSNVKAIPSDMVPKLQEYYPDHDWPLLSRNGQIVMDAAKAWQREQRAKTDHHNNV